MNPGMILAQENNIKRGLILKNDPEFIELTEA